MSLLQISMIGGLMILVITALRRILQHRVHRSVFLILWAAAVLRLLTPGIVEATWGAINPSVLEGQKPTEVVVVRQEAQKMEQEIVIPSKAIAEEPPVSVPQILWAAGAAGLLVFLAVSHLRQRLRYRFSLPLPEGISTPENLRVRMLDGLEAPLTYGLFRPVVLLPVDFPLEEEDRLRHVLLHEEIHVRKHDVLKKAVLLLTACIHWFNPLVWLMVALASEDMEMRCDAEVIRQLGREARLGYATTLVEAERSRVMGLLQTGFSFSSTERRIRELARAKGNPVISGLCLVVLTAGLTFGFFTMQMKAAPTPVVVVEYSQTETAPAARRTVASVRTDNKEAPMQTIVETTTETTRYYYYAPTESFLDRISYTLPYNPTSLVEPRATVSLPTVSIPLVESPAPTIPWPTYTSFWP